MNFLFFVGFFYYYVFLILPFQGFVEWQFRGLGVKEPGPGSIRVLATALVIVSWFLFWGRLPFPFFGFHR